MKNDFIKCVGEKKPYFFDGDFDHQFSWNHLIKILDNTNAEDLNTNWDKIRFTILKMEARSERPKIVDQVLRVLNNTFYKNPGTCHIFGNFTRNGQSFAIHRDPMDVLYVQSLGSAKLTVYKSEVNASTIELNECEQIFQKYLHKGDAVWIPRHVHHLIEPLESRVGFSFGVEGEIDPSTYI